MRSSSPGSWAAVMACVMVVTSQVIPLVSAKVEITHVSTVYLPSFDTNAPEYDAGAVEQIAYDPEAKVIYAVGNQVFHVISVSSDGQLVTEQSNYLKDKDITDVEVCGGRVYMNVVDEKNRATGLIRVYGGFQKGQTDEFPFLDEIQVGSLPDMLLFTNDCKTAVVAVEAEAYMDGKTFVDPEGQVAIIRFTNASGPNTTHTVNSLNFNAFDDRYSELQPSGLRFIYQKHGNTLSADLEPEYVAIDDAANKAYVMLQENNGVAEVDLDTDNITNIYGLGAKQWGYFDASDEDKGIAITFWPIKAWYLPDATKFHEWQGRKLLFTANEGDAKEYKDTNFDEAVRGKDISQKDIGVSVHPFVKEALAHNSRLGRLQVSKYDGKDASGKYQDIYTYGGRSFAIWSLPGEGSNQDPSVPLTQLFDSGSDFEEKTALYCPHLYNRNDDTIDGRSDNKGPEPESLTMAEMNGRLYIFIGIERPGSIFVYSIGRDVTRPRFETIFCDGIPNNGKTIETQFDDREIYAVDPEDVRFYPADQSPTGRPVLLVAGVVSGTVSILDVNITADATDDQEFGFGGEF